MLTSIKKADTIIIYDFSNLAYASYYVATDFIEDEHGEKTAITNLGYMIYIAINSVLNVIRLMDDGKTALVFALDHFPVHKLELVPSYKQNRTKLETDPRPLMIEVFKSFKCYFAETADQEADDVIATIAKQYHKEKVCFIITADQDMLQLNGMKNVDIFDPRTKEFWDKERYKEKYGLTRWSNIILFKSCFGDASDNIKSALPRVQKKYVLPVLNSMKTPSLKKFMKKFDKSEQTKRTKEVYAENKDKLKSNYKIVKLNKDLTVKLSKGKASQKLIKKHFKKLKIKKITPSKLEALL